MKEIKDYLHLYLGCDLIFDNKAWELWRVSGNHASLKSDEREQENSCYLSECKPILRPLSNMSEEERKESSDTSTNPEQIRFLLSKHFDLFELIEAGLAIDSTTLR